MSGRAPLITGSWVLKYMLKPFVELAAVFAHCTLHDDDWTAIEYGVRDSNVDKDNWFHYYLEGADPLYLELARNPGSDVVSVTARGNIELARELNVIFFVCQSYRLASLGPHV